LGAAAPAATAEMDFYDRAAAATVSAVKRISLNVVVFNEEARLEECLVDARDHVDEIVVVDQMSTDGTPEIAQRLADVYVRDVQHGHAEPSRELAASRSSGEWILILDADEKMSDLLKSELPGLVDRNTDGYWIQKSNVVDGEEVSTIQHFRLVRKARVRFDPRPHGGATAVSDNVESFERVGIIHEKSVAEQIFDDTRYERLALEDDAPTSAKRNWLSHNRALREHRERSSRSDLEALVPADAVRVLVVGDVPVELPGCLLSRTNGAGPLTGTAAMAASSANGGHFDAAVLSLADGDGLRSLRSVRDLVRPGGVIVATAPAARNRRRMEEYVAALVSDGNPPDRQLSDGGMTRRELLDALAGAGLDPRWMTLVRDGWLNPVALRPDGSPSVVESDEFLLRSVPAEVAEELTAAEIVFAAVRKTGTRPPGCSIVLVTLSGTDPQRFADALMATAPKQDYELIAVQSHADQSPVPGASSVLVPDSASLSARRNAGARAAGGELVVFVAADALPLAGWLDSLVDAYRSRPDTGAVGSKVIVADGTIGHAGLVLGPDRVPYRLYEGELATAPHVMRPRIMPAVLAEGMVTSRAQFVEVGGFDETLGDDLSDADYCLRVRARGRPILFAPSAELRSPLRTVPGTRDSFRRSAREFATRWSPAAFRSDELVCRSDGLDPNWEWNRSWRLPRPAAPAGGGLPAIAWSSHFLEHGGYTEEALAAVEALEDAGLQVIANPVTWDSMGTPLPAHKAERLAGLLTRELPEHFVHVAHIGANRFKRHPAAICNIGRTMFETDGLPADWRDQCNAMDEIWVPSEHNLQTFANAGVDPAKLHRVPETFDAGLFEPTVAPLAVEDLHGFVFLSVFSWIDRKAWDALLRAWVEEFDAHDDVTLLLKTDAALATPGTDCRREVDAFVRNQLGRKPSKIARIVVIDSRLEVADIPRLYRTADAFVLASRGEGWGRPYMEAMAMGLPTIATRWSGNLEFMNDDNSYLVGYKLVDTPPDSWLRGQRWAEPSISDLRRAMRRVYEHQTEAAATGKRARADVLVSCRPELVVEAVRERLEAVVRRGARGVARANASRPTKPLTPSTRARRVGDGRRISACIVVQDDRPSLSQCLASVRELADATIVVEAGASDDLAAARNEALDQATGSWVIMLDAAHTLDPASVDLVREFVAQDRFVGYAARELHQFGFDGAVSAIEQRTAFLFPRHPGLRYVGRVAEQLLPQGDLEFRLIQSRVGLHRHDHRHERRHPVASARRQLPLLERSAREEPGEPFHLYNLGVALQRLGLNVEAEKALRTAIKRAPRRVIWGPSAYATLSRAVAAQGQPDAAVKLCKTATKLAPQWAQGWCMLGEALVDASRPMAALRAYAVGLECGAETMLPGDAPDDTAWQIRGAMAKIHLAREEYGEAADCLTGAVALNPTNAELHVLLARAYESARRSGDARRQLDHAVTATRAGADAYLALSDFFTKKAEEALLRGLVDNRESHVLLERIEQLRAVRGVV
jgi:glycosyltransferase involved in cell wall biosynthesis/GT2 family glycosyltransferase/cytochrome c-type biogenesis protein CcmH/NrfG